MQYVHRHKFSHSLSHSTRNQATAWQDGYQGQNQTLQACGEITVCDSVLLEVFQGGCEIMRCVFDPGTLDRPDRGLDFSSCVT